MTNATDTAYHAIHAGILNGTFAPDERLKETHLVQFCGVSRTPVREALRRLEAEGLVQIHRNHGAQVKSWSERDLDDLFALRGLLEGFAAARAASRISQSQLRAIAAAIVAMDEVLSSKRTQSEKVAQFLDLNRVVHETVWAAADSERLLSILNRLVDQALVAHTAKRYSVARLAHSHHHHAELLAALEVGDSTWAEAIMTSHIRAARQALDPGARTGEPLVLKLLE